MRFFALAISALAALASAQTSGKPNAFNVPKEGNYLLHAGQPITLTWSNKSGSTVTLTLRDGANTNLSKGTVIADKIQNSGSFTYTPPKDIVEGANYAIEIKNDQNPSEVNYTPQFVITSDVKAVETAKTGSKSATATDMSSATDSASATMTSATATDASATASSTNSASRSSSSQSATGSRSSVPTDNAGRVVKVGTGLLAVAAGFAVVM